MSRLEVTAVAQAYLEDAFDHPMKALFLSPELFNQFTEVRRTAYTDRGMIPPMLSSAAGLVLMGFCLPIIVTQTEAFDPDDFLAYLIYWAKRMRVRVQTETELNRCSGGGWESVEEDFLEELVESTMLAEGLNRWWQPLLKEGC